MSMRFYPSGKTFPLQPNHVYGFTFGVLNDQQLLLKRERDGVLRLLFSHEGDLREIAVVPRLPNEDSKTAFSRVISDLGLTPQPITVKQFYVPAYGVGIREFPGYLEEFLLNPERYVGGTDDGGEEDINSLQKE